MVWAVCHVTPPSAWKGSYFVLPQQLNEYPIDYIYPLSDCTQATTITPNDQFLLLACDGLFDVFTPEEVVTSVRTFLEKHKDVQKCCQVSSRTP